MGKKTGSVSGMNKQDHNSESLENQFFGVKILKLFDADPGSGIKKIQIRDPGWKKFGSGINIPDPRNTAQIQSFSYDSEKAKFGSNSFGTHGSTKP